MNVLRIALLAALGSAGASAQTPSPKPATSVLAILSPVDVSKRDAIMATMQAEIRDTVQLYLDGRIQQWYSRTDGRGVVFLLDCRSVEEAKALTDQLPLIKAKLAKFDFIALSPLRPLGLLLDGGGKSN